MSTALAVQLPYPTVRPLRPCHSLPTQRTQAARHSQKSRQEVLMVVCVSEKEYRSLVSHRAWFLRRCREAVLMGLLLLPHLLMS